MKYLLSTVVKYRVDTDAEAKALIEENKASNFGEVTKYSSVHKEQKETKTREADEWYEVTITRFLNDPKDCYAEVDVSYEVNEV